MGQIGFNIVFELTLHELKEANKIQYIPACMQTLFSSFREKPVIKAFHCMHRPGLVTIIRNLFSDLHILAVFCQK